jgi:hypothetical protein
MLAASRETRFGTALVHSTVLLERRFWVFVVSRTGLVYDTRFVPGAEGESSKVIAYILLRGTFEVLAPVRQRFEAPCAFLLEQDQHEGSLGRRTFFYRAFGDHPYIAIELRVAPDDVCCGATPRPARMKRGCLPDRQRGSWRPSSALFAMSAADGGVSRDARVSSWRCSGSARWIPRWAKWRAGRDTAAVKRWAAPSETQGFPRHLQYEPR